MLENIDFADDNALLSSTMNYHQFQTIKLNDKSAKGGMKIKCLVVKPNSKSEVSLTVEKGKSGPCKNVSAESLRLKEPSPACFVI